VRRRRGRKRPTGTRTPITIPQAASQRWPLDFVADVLVHGSAVPTSGDRGRLTCEALPWSSTLRSAAGGACPSSGRGWPYPEERAPPVRGRPAVRPRPAPLRDPYNRNAGAAMNNQDSHRRCGTEGEQVKGEQISPSVEGRADAPPESGS
jgi:hypothetical protein